MAMTTSTAELCERLSRASRTSDPWGRYYTSPAVSQSLVDSIKESKPNLVLELGSGSGSLCSAAATRWRDAKLVTVDVDRQPHTRYRARDKNSQQRHRHYVHDVLDEALSERIGLRLGTVDVAVCNPPYIRPRWRADFGKILEAAGLSNTLTSLHDASADLLFLAQNLRLLRPNGKLGLILPDGLVAAERFVRVRRALLRQHRIEQVVQLPRGVFKGTEAQTYLAVISKQAGETHLVSLRQMDHGGRLSAMIAVPQDVAEKRLDYSFYNQAHPSTPSRYGQRRIAVSEALTKVVRVSTGFSN